MNYASFAVSASIFGPFVLRRFDVDVILVYEPSPITVGIPAAVIKWVKKAPILFWVQDLWPESLLATGAIRNRWALDAIRRLVRFIYSQSDIVIGQSRGFVEKIREVAPKDKDVRFFPNPADHHFRPLNPPEDAPERQLLPDGFRIVCAGNMGAAQDLGNVIDAAERLQHRPEIQWILIGDGRLRPWLAEQVQARGLASVVHIIGPYPPQQMPTFFALADLLLATLRRDDAFSLTVPSRIQAYLASGRPILAAIDGEGARIIEEAQAGLTCPPGDPARLADAVLRLYEAAPADREAMGLAGRRYFEREFDRDMLVARLDRWLREAQKVKVSL
jgi:glycosyltransferase involved in cell wall biosynthesis